ncbi:MAG: VPLPA-CTERM-specific exosortase XrtD [Oceanicoccus sp.]|uniref:VPLPA-CTERM-specific exosortase XrtD n=1 Tax=Oceanicoccus sp. TaxID=2691044 RepID=UPI00263365C0|nr:VPLPA-CTERM-specific exosortase XrtD [Oceanicoccus sp.]MCP3908871.1 VPLPA-CTERM-specific exosortase XrtD [Oceanicoccus sp.]
MVSNDNLSSGSNNVEGETPPNEGYALLWVLLVAAFGLLIIIFQEGLGEMVGAWDREEYSHGFMIPLVAAYLIWQKQQQLPSLTSKGSWLGLIGTLLGLMAFFIGEMATVYEVVQYGFLLCVVSLFLAFLGWRPTALLWAAFVYLLFMVPLPQFVYKALSSELQLISSAIGVAVVRLFDISVYLEGNIIDLGVYKLQVVEACSGLRYLFPLMSFGFLIAYLYKVPAWQRAFLFLSTIPITVLMNSFRIGVIGVTVEYWGIEMAEGFLHDFEGWVVFMGCLGVLVLEMWLLHLFSKSKLNMWDKVDLDMPDEIISLSQFNISWKKQRPFIACLVLIVTALLGKQLLETRETMTLERTELKRFPLYNQKWIGRESSIENNVLGVLKLTDYLMANYTTRTSPLPINFYIAYYESQRQGAAIHSPRTCIPGGGWEFKGLDQLIIPGVKHMSGEPLEVNRVLIRKDNSAQIVYYWFEQRGRNITDEYEAKWYVFYDSMMDNRTDGALVRVTVPVPDIDNIEESEQHGIKFIQDFYPLIPDYIPGAKL